MKWAIQRLHVEKWWSAKVNPLELIYKKTRQKILFRGLDDPLKLTSISVETGAICFLWCEEAYEITKEDDFDYLDECIRGKLPPGLWKRVTITFNPWNNRHWLKKRFFDKPSDNVLAMTTNYKCNEWLDEANLKLFEDMKKIIRAGTMWRDNDPTALFCGMVSKKNKEIYVFDELYKKGMSNEQIYADIEKLGYRKEKIIADSAEPKSIERLRVLGMYRVRPARKGQDSILFGIISTKRL